MEDITAKQEPKRIPYGMMNFVDVRNDNCYYVVYRGVEMVACEEVSSN